LRFLSQLAQNNLFTRRYLGPILIHGYSEGIIKVGKIKGHIQLIIGLNIGVVKIVEVGFSLILGFADLLWHPSHIIVVLV
jgi:hypothetical protein